MTKPETIAKQLGSAQAEAKTTMKFFDIMFSYLTGSSKNKTCKPHFTAGMLGGAILLTGAAFLLFKFTPIEKLFDWSFIFGT